MARFGRLLTLLLVLSACAGQTPVPPTPSPAQWLAVTPALEPAVRRWFSAYAAEVEVPEFDLRVLPYESALQAARQGEASAALIGGPPPEDWFATPLGSLEILVILNAENPIESFPRGQLSDVFAGRIQSWDTLGWLPIPIQPIVPLPGDELRMRFEEAIPAVSPFSSLALLGPSPVETLEMVRQDRGAIGIIPAMQISEGVRTVGLDPSAGNGGSGERLEVAITATSPREPADPIRAWLVWLQSNPEMIKP